MNWRALTVVALLATLALGFAPAFSQASSSSGGTASVSLHHDYTINAYGNGVLNDTFTFSNKGNSSVQVPTLQVGLPSKVASRIQPSGLVLSPSDEFALSESQTNGNTTVTITPDQTTLAAGATSTVMLEGVVNDIMNYTNGVYMSNETALSLILVSPSVNVNLAVMNSTIAYPSGGALAPYPTNFTLSAANDSLTYGQTMVRPVASEAYLNFTASTESTFTPIRVDGLVRTIVPSANGIPIVEDQFTIHNYADYAIASIHLNLVNPGLGTVTVIADTEPPLLNPFSSNLSSGYLTFSSANIGSPLLADSNVTITVSYALPAKLMTVSGDSVSVTVPTTPIIGAPTGNESIVLAAAKGVSPSGQTAFKEAVNPLTTGDVTFTYSVSFGWAADDAIPAGALIFAVGFVMFAIQRPQTEEEEEEVEKTGHRVADVLNSFEEKMGLETQYMNELASASKGSVGKNEFDKMRNEVSELRSRAIQRLNQVKQALGSGRQFNVLTRVAEAEKEEDRAFRDLLNLYQQYHGNRMNEETYKRLQPIQRKRVDAAINKLSDLLHETQTEEN